MHIYFGIDCAPCSPRPDTYAKLVFDKLGVEPIAAYNKMFGAWEWEVVVDNDFDFQEFNSWMKSTMDKLYNSGYIRGAQWNKVE